MKQLLLSLLILFTNNWLFGQSPSNQVASEDDWSLPSYVKPTENSGYYGGYGAPNFPDVEQCKIVWSLVNPSPGVYDWTSVEKQLNATKKQVWVRFFASDTSHCPRWLKTKYADFRVHRYRWPDGGYDDVVGYLNGNSTVRSMGDFYEIWDPRFEAEFRTFLKQFKNKYGASDRIVFCYFPHGWRWNEWSLKWIPEIVAQGTTPEQFINWYKRTAADYIDAFNGQAGKLVYTGSGEPEWIEWPKSQTASDSWNSAINVNGGNIMSQYAMQQGMGVRNGFTEVFNHFSQQKDWGVNLKTIGAFRYSTVDETNPLIEATNRFFGTENEDYSYMWEPECNNYYYHKMCYLVTLRLRMNWVFAGSYAVAPDIIEYSRKTMGKHVYDSPDAWVALRQYADDNVDKNANIRNFERWLYQRDIAADGITKATYPIAYPTQFAADNGASANEALSTTHSTGGDYIYFDVDDQFLKGGNNEVQIKITYLDNFTGSWYIEYEAFSVEPYKKSLRVNNSNDNKWKTTTFDIADATFSNSQKGGMDFRIYNGGTKDISVRFVRLVKINEPLVTSTYSKGDDKKVVLHPSPAKDALYFEDILSGTPYEIMSIDGKLLQKGLVDGVSINVENLSAGVYIIRLGAEVGGKVQRFVKE